MLNIIAYGSIITGVVSAPMFLFSCIPYIARRHSRAASRVASVSFVVFVLSIVVGLSSSWVASSIARDEVKGKLQAAGDNCQISINGKPAPHSEKILSVLKTLHTSPGHHSHPTHAIGIDVSYHPESFALPLARDSDDPKEYWVFLPSIGLLPPKRLDELRLPHLMATR